MRAVLTVVVCVMLLLSGALPAETFAIADAAPGPTIQGDARTVAELNEIYKKFAEAKTWRSRMQIPGSPPSTYNIAHVAPDRYHMVLNTGSGTLEYYVVGNEAWVKTGGGCAKVPARVNFPNPKEGLQQNADAVVQVTRGGTETVEGTPTQTYNLVTTAQGTTTRQKLYAATATGLPRRNEISLREGTMVIDYSDFGALITINNPPC